jgi:hypothetical protein
MTYVYSISSNVITNTFIWILYWNITLVCLFYFVEIFTILDGAISRFGPLSN